MCFVWELARRLSVVGRHGRLKLYDVEDVVSELIYKNKARVLAPFVVPCGRRKAHTVAVLFRPA